MKYSIDTSALLEAWVRHYPRDVFPALWSSLEELIESGDLAATEEVLIELERKADDVHEWAKDRRAAFFVPLDDAVQERVTHILAAHEKLVDTRRNRSGADPFVIALAMVNGCAVVTAEGATGKADRPNIPDVCAAEEIPCIGLVELFRTRGWRF